MGSLPHDNAPPLGTQMTLSSAGMGRQDTTEETPTHRLDRLLTARGASVLPAPAADLTVLAAPLWFLSPGAEPTSTSAQSKRGKAAKMWRAQERPPKASTSFGVVWPQTS